MLTLTVGLICMVVGYYLGTKETDKKWIAKQKPTPGCLPSDITFMTVTTGDGCSHKIDLRNLESK